MGVTARQQRVFDKPQSVDKSMKEAVALQEKNQQKVKAEEKTVYAKAKERLAVLKSGKWKEYKAKMKRTAKELIGGKNTYLPKKKKD